MIIVLLLTIFCTFNVKDSTTGAELKVVGGRQAKKGEYPFLVSLQWKTHGHFCGGNLISFDRILTACHCMCSFRTGLPFMFLVRDIIAVAGVENYNSEGRQVMQIYKSERHIHCGLGKGGGWTFDYGIYTLSRPFSRYYQGNTVSTIPVYSWNPVELRTKIKEMINKSVVCQGAGWGYKTVEFDKEADDFVYKDPSETLKSIDVTLWSLSTCQTELCKQPVMRCLPEGELGRRNQVCGKAPDKEDVCEGDSGGPLVCNGYVIGILSWGPACGQHPYPSMYGSIEEAYNLEMFASSEYIQASITLLAVSVFIHIKNYLI
ncbi:trypsin theta-like [Cimex lectularius]|uniref:Peptidase S1 domain-containing protein n=1 Tax=Cimex lectularius TaxID=79782 RepID=A0A8I6RZR0_CIMLE|nr:trypsin theta-like [Cimex lectularius]